ncbi:MAG: hypothetical protein HFG32_13380 [Eubacterium sp.]|nr:hypothetical protein [Eubacterium sp.]
MMKSVDTITTETVSQADMARIPLKVSVIYAHRIICRERFTVRKKKRRVRIIK